MENPKSRVGLEKIWFDEFYGNHNFLLKKHSCNRSFEKISGIGPKYEKSKKKTEIILNMKDSKILKFSRGIKKNLGFLIF